MRTPRSFWRADDCDGFEPWVKLEALEESLGDHSSGS